MKQPDPDGGKLTVAEAGRRGGRQTLRRHGLAHYQRIGAKGAARVHRLLTLAKEHETGPPLLVPEPEQEPS